MTKDTGGPAFPVKGGMVFYAAEEHRKNIEEAVNQIERNYEGMTLRDWFAGQALAGIMAGMPSERVQKMLSGETGVNLTMVLATTLADAMIAERSKP